MQTFTVTIRNEATGRQQTRDMQARTAEWVARLIDDEFYKTFGGYNHVPHHTVEICHDNYVEVHETDETGLLVQVDAHIVA